MKRLEPATGATTAIIAEADIAIGFTPSSSMATEGIATEIVTTATVEIDGGMVTTAEIGTAIAIEIAMAMTDTAMATTVTAMAATATEIATATATATATDF